MVSILEDLEKLMGSFMIIAKLGQWSAGPLHIRSFGGFLESLIANMYTCFPGLTGIKCFYLIGLVLGFEIRYLKVNHLRLAILRAVGVNSAAHGLSFHNI